MSRMARCTWTSLAALCLTALAWAAPAPAPKALPTIGYLPGGDAAVEAPLLEGLREGLKGTNVRLVIGRRAAQWSNAAPEAVRLRVKEGAGALVTPPERRVAHLMAQVATRTQVHVISTSEAPTVGATGSTWVVMATKERPKDAAGWRALGRRAAALAMERLAR